MHLSCVSIFDLLAQQNSSIKIYRCTQKCTAVYIIGSLMNTNRPREVESETDWLVAEGVVPDASRVSSVSTGSRVIDDVGLIVT